MATAHDGRLRDRSAAARGGLLRDRSAAARDGQMMDILPLLALRQRIVNKIDRLQASGA